jgi:catechol 2,3-dioxygenase-like lactoylglutathione lyase family enzyme
MFAFNDFRAVLFTENYDEELFFYRDALGLEPNYTWDVKGLNRGTRFYFCGAKLEIVSGPGPAAVGKSSVLAGSADVPGCYAAVKAAPGVKIISGPSDTGEGETFAFEDPAGNVITVNGRVGGSKIEWGRKTFFDAPFGAFVSAADPEKSRAFYSGLLGLKAETEGLRFAAGRGFIELKAGKALPGRGASVIGLEALNVNACCRSLKNQGIPFLADLRDVYYGARLFQIQDPDGNVIEIYSWLENIRDAEAVG